MQPGLPSPQPAENRGKHDLPVFAPEMEQQTLGARIRLPLDPFEEDAKALSLIWIDRLQKTDSTFEVPAE